MLVRASIVVALAALAACTSPPADDAGLEDATVPDASFDAADGGRLHEIDVAPIFTDAACGAQFMLQNEDLGIHVPEDAMVTYSTNPPCSGPHYPDWAMWGVHDDIVPREYYVHNLEHGGVAVLYRCDGDCSALRSQLVGFVDSLRPEPLCVGTGVNRRVLLTEDPLIDVPVAAAAWSWTYKAQCFDLPSLSAFVYARTGHAPEDTCAQGTYP